MGDSRCKVFLDAQIVQSELHDLRCAHHAVMLHCIAHSIELRLAIFLAPVVWKLQVQRGREHKAFRISETDSVMSPLRRDICPENKFARFHHDYRWPHHSFHLLQHGNHV